MSPRLLNFIYLILTIIAFFVLGLLVSQMPSQIWGADSSGMLRLIILLAFYGSLIYLAVRFIRRIFSPARSSSTNETLYSDNPSSEVRTKKGLSLTSIFLIAFIALFIFFMYLSRTPWGTVDFKLLYAGILLMLLAVTGWIYLGKKRFERTNQFGVQTFDSFNQVMKAGGSEYLVRLLCLLLSFLGLVAFIAGVMCREAHIDSGLQITMSC